MNDAVPQPSGLTRRSLLAAAVAAVTPRAQPVARTQNPRLSIAEPPQFTTQPFAQIQHRFDLYRQMGVGTLRVAVEWWDEEPAEGRWHDSTRQTYMWQAIQSGFRFKVQVGTISTPPGWFLDKYPDAQMLNHDRIASRSDISYWYPGLRAVMADKADRLFASIAKANLMGSIDYVFVDCGPAAEPIYPAAWTLGPGLDPALGSFWFYDAHAQADFGPKMKALYGGDLARANGAWGTTFATWGDVAVPEVGTRPGQLWADVLTWYRAVKRDFITWQIGNYQTLLRRYGSGRVPQLVLMLAGSHILPSQWQDAVRSSGGDSSIEQMDDSEFLIDLARRTGCWLQDTGVENAAEVAYLRDYMNATGGELPMWGENAGSPEVGADPQRVADVINAQGLYGFEYVGAQFLFDADGIAPTSTVSKLRSAFFSITSQAR